MPLVFVHGVATRDGPGVDAYDQAVAERDLLFKKLLLSDDVESPYPGDPINPYWGEYGAKFAFGMSCLPEPGGNITLGPGEQQLAAELGLAGEDHPDTLLGRVAQESLLEAIDLALLLAIETAEQRGRPPGSDLLKVASIWADWALAQEGDPPKARWAHGDMTNDDFLAQVHTRVKAWSQTAGSDVELGIGTALNAIASGVSRLTGNLRNLASRAALVVTRDMLHDKVAMFIGDVFVYLGDRGDPNGSAKIIREITGKIAQADQQRTDGDPLILIGHSLGGVILYDILTDYFPENEPEFEADALITVGSQVGLFEEMKLFRASERDTGSGKKKAKAPAAKVWVNVYDEVDVLSFQAAPIFERVADYGFSSRTGVVSAHGAYFKRPTFHRRLRKRLQEAGVPMP